MISVFGESNDKTIEAYNSLLSAQIEFEELKTSMSDVLEESYQHSADWINTQKEYNRLSAKEELEAWQRVQARYKEGTEQRKAADKEVYQAKHALIDSSVAMLDSEIKKQKELIATLREGTVEYQNAAKELEHLTKTRRETQYSDSVAWMEDEEFYGRGGLIDRTAGHTRMYYNDDNYKFNDDIGKQVKKNLYTDTHDYLDKKKNYEEERTSIEEEYAQRRMDLETEYRNNVKAIQEQEAQDIKDANAVYEDALESRADTLYNSYGLFDEVAKKEKVSANKLYRNLQDQNAELEDWADTMNSLKNRGLSDELIEELQDMGPSAIAELKSLNSMSDSQLQQYANMWSDKHKLARERATDELVWLREDTDAEIAEIKANTQDSLDELYKTWQQNLSDTNEECHEKLTKLTKTFLEDVGALAKYTQEEVDKGTEELFKLLDLKGFDQKGQQLGEQLVTGLIKGVENLTPDVKTALSNLGFYTSDAYSEATEIHSPSRVFVHFGKCLDKGLILGINSLSGKVTDASDKLGEDTIRAVASRISRVSDILSSDEPITPTVAPIVDLSGLNNQIYANKSVELGMRLNIGSQNDLINQMNENVAKLADANLESNNKLTEAIDELRSDFNEMVETVSRMQVIMDSGALVGAISPQMDRRLGVASVMQRRGV